MRARHVVIKPSEGTVRAKWWKWKATCRLDSDLGHRGHRVASNGLDGCRHCRAASGRDRADGRAMAWPVSAHVSLIAYRQVTAKRPSTTSTNKPGNMKILAAPVLHAVITHEISTSFSAIDLSCYPFRSFYAHLSAYVPFLFITTFVTSQGGERKTRSMTRRTS